MRIRESLYKGPSMRIRCSKNIDSFPFLLPCAFKDNTLHSVEIRGRTACKKNGGMMPQGGDHGLLESFWNYFNRILCVLASRLFTAGMGRPFCPVNQLYSGLEWVISLSRLRQCVRVLLWPPQKAQTSCLCLEACRSSCYVTGTGQGTRDENRKNCVYC